MGCFELLNCGIACLELLNCEIVCFELLFSFLFAVCVRIWCICAKFMVCWQWFVNINDKELLVMVIHLFLDKTRLLRGLT